MLIAFSVPSILVPDTFTFAGAITNVVSAAAVGFAGTQAGPSTGQFVDTYALGGGMTPQSLGSNFEFQGRVIASAAPAAVPEPASIALLGLGIAGWVALGRKQA